MTDFDKEMRSEIIQGHAETAGILYFQNKLQNKFCVNSKLS